MSSHLRVAQLAEWNMCHKGDLSVAKDAHKGSHHNQVPGLKVAASFILISWSLSLQKKNTRGAEGALRRDFPCAQFS